MVAERIIDSAVRIESTNDETEIQALLDRMDQHGIERSVVAPGDAQVAVDNAAGNARMAELATRYPKRLLGLAVANPWYGSQAVRTLERAFDEGLSGLYLHPGRQGFHLVEAVIHPLIEVCRHRRKPVYSHTGTPVCAEPFQLAELARQFPDVTFVMGHAGYSDFWYDVAAASRQAPNLLLDTSCQVAGALQAAIDAVGAERVLFGSAWPRSAPGVEIRKLELMNLPSDVFQCIVRTNALRTWRITP
jgi:uncharacterized protein